MSWLSRHAGAIEACAASVTALVAVAALIGIKYQLDATDVSQRSQSARDAYRSHLALASAHPEFAKPMDACELSSGAKAGSYSAFVDHLLYSAEQMLAVEEGWKTTFSDALEPHAAYMCSKTVPDWSTPEMGLFLAEFEGAYCANIDVAIACD